MKIDWQKKNITLGGWAKQELEREEYYVRWLGEIGVGERRILRQVVGRNRSWREKNITLGGWAK